MKEKLKVVLLVSLFLLFTIAGITFLSGFNQPREAKTVASEEKAKQGEILPEMAASLGAMAVSQMEKAAVQGARDAQTKLEKKAEKAKAKSEADTSDGNGENAQGEGNTDNGSDEGSEAGTSADSSGEADESGNSAEDTSEANTPERESDRKSGHVVLIDPGHQAHGDSATEPNGPGSSTMKARVTGGTRGTSTGVYEYELTLDISLQLRDELRSRGYTVYMTRETHDVNISNMERAKMAEQVGADISVRIHANGADSGSTNGALALVPSASNPYIPQLAAESKRLGEDILNAYCSVTGLVNLGVSGNDTMTGINWSSVPVMILEMGFMTNAAEDEKMEDSDFQQKMVRGIADGIDKYFE